MKRTIKYFLFFIALVFLIPSHLVSAEKQYDSERKTII